MQRIIVNIYFKPERFNALSPELVFFIEKTIYEHPCLLEQTAKEYLTYICSFQNNNNGPDPRLLYGLLLSFFCNEKISFDLDMRSVLLENFKGMSNFLESFIKILFQDLQRHTTSIFSFLSNCSSNIHLSLQLGDFTQIIVTKYIIKICIGILDDQKNASSFKTLILDLLFKILNSFFQFFSQHMSCGHLHASPNWSFIQNNGLFKQSCISLCYVACIIDQHDYSILSKANPNVMDCPFIGNMGIFPLLNSFAWISIYPFIQNVSFKMFQFSF